MIRSLLSWIIPDHKEIIFTLPWKESFWYIMYISVTTPENDVKKSQRNTPYFCFIQTRKGIFIPKGHHIMQYLFFFLLCHHERDKNIEDICIHMSSCGRQLSRGLYYASLNHIALTGHLYSWLALIAHYCKAPFYPPPLPFCQWIVLMKCYNKTCSTFVSHMAISFCKTGISRLAQITPSHPGIRTQEVTFACVAITRGLDIFTRSYIR